MEQSEKDAARGAALYQFDKNEYPEGGGILVGVDEVGRGPLAGPVVAAAVVLDLSSPLTGIDDSKKIPQQKREKVYLSLVKHAETWAVGSASPEEVDSLNILQATFLAMKRAIESLACSWTSILVDGNQKIPHFDPSVQKTVVRGDGKSASIAAASILAKVTRDRYMVEMHRTYPDYFFAKNKGYGTKEHRSMLLKKGMCPIHRRTFCENILLQTTLDI